MLDYQNRVVLSLKSWVLNALATLRCRVPGLRVWGVREPNRNVTCFLSREPLKATWPEKPKWRILANMDSGRKNASCIHRRGL
jgi:hypothetical protein